MNLLAVPATIFIEEVVLTHLSMADVARFEVACSNTLLRQHFHSTISRTLESDSDRESTSENSDQSDCDDENCRSICTSTLHGNESHFDFKSRMFNQLIVWPREDEVIRSSSKLAWMMRNRIFLKRLRIDISPDISSSARSDSVLTQRQGATSSLGDIISIGKARKYITSLIILKTDVSPISLFHATPNLESIVLSSSNSNLEATRWLIQHRPLLRRIRIDSHMIESTVILIGQCCPLLEYLSCKRARFSDEGFRAVANGCKLLETCIAPLGHVHSREVCHHFVRSCTRLKRLNTAILSSYLQLLVDSCSHLTDLTLRLVGLLGDHDDAFREFFRNQSLQLTTLRLSTSLSLETYLEIPRMSSITSLSFVLCDELNGHTVRTILQQMPQLESLLIHRQSMYEDDCCLLSVLEKHCPNLKDLSHMELYHEYFDRYCVIALSKSLCQLRTLRIVTMKLEPNIARDIILRHRQTLETLHISVKCTNEETFYGLLELLSFDGSLLADLYINQTPYGIDIRPLKKDIIMSFIRRSKRLKCLSLDIIHDELVEIQKEVRKMSRNIAISKAAIDLFYSQEFMDEEEGLYR